MSKKYPIKASKELKAKLKPFWIQLQRLEDENYSKILKLEGLQIALPSSF